MKKEVLKEVSICDGCGKEIAVLACLGCGVEHCWECREKEGIEYATKIYYSEYNCGYYCKECDGKLTISGSDPIHNEYVSIAKLCKENSDFYKAFKIRFNKAEKKLKDLIAL